MNSDSTNSYTTVDAGQISLLDMLIVLAKHKTLIFVLPFVVAVIAAAFSLAMTDIFTASAKILPPQQNQSSATAMLAQLGNVAGLVGGAGGGKGPNDLYVAMLKSRTVADHMIQRFDLMSLYNAQLPSQARASLAAVTTITVDKSGVIAIDVDDKNPKVAAELANGYVEELFKLTRVLAVTEASQRRLFFERQLAQAKESLVNAEAAARQALDRGGLVKVDDQGRAMIEANARLRGQITVQEVQIGAMRSFATDQNPGLQRAQRELESMKRELAKIEGAGGAKTTITASNGQGADSLRLLRDVKYNEVIFEALARQYEIAKIDEAKDSAILQVMDNAIAPDRKSKPKRALIVVLSVLTALFAAVVWAFAREAIAKADGDPQQSARLQAIKRYIAWR
jgi:tyrosine-protein kinase Etk/Wzc